jgi:SAM-dependent methyltransferase
MTARARVVGRYFDEVAASYAGRYTDPGPAGHALAIRWQRIFELLGEAAGPALDAGCGPGLLVAAFAERGLRAVGVDLSARMAAEAARRGPAVVGTLDRLPFADAAFGVVVAAGAVEYVADDRRALAELVRVLRPGGVVVASFPNRFSPYRLWKNAVFYPLVDRLRPLVARARGRPTPLAVTAYHHHYTVGEVCETLGALGCAVEDVVFMNQQVVPSPLDEWLPSLSVALSRRLEPFGRALAGRLGTAFLVRAVKRPAGLRGEMP